MALDKVRDDDEPVGLLSERVAGRKREHPSGNRERDRRVVRAFFRDALHPIRIGRIGRLYGDGITRRQFLNAVERLVGLIEDYRQVA